MNRKIAFSMALIIFLLSFTYFAVKVQRVKASGTIYIRADGSIEPLPANITSVDNVTYTFTGNISDGIVAERNDTIIDGGEYTLQGSGDGVGLNLTSVQNITIRNMNIKNFEYGIQLEASSEISIQGNNITNNFQGVRLSSSNYNAISGNNITANNLAGVQFSFFANYYNTISGNHITSNSYGIWVEDSDYNEFYHNYIDNINQTYLEPGYANIWDKGYPTGGNYWSDYEDKYPNATEIDESGIWDTPYVIDESNQDNYPIVPEIPSLLVLPVFMATTLLTALAYRRKHDSDA